MSRYNLTLEDRKMLVELLRKARRGLLELNSKTERKSIELIKVKTIHQKYNEKGNYVKDVELDLSKHESDGTNALFALAGPIYDTLKNNKILLIDELTSKLHPVLTRALIEIFHSYKADEKANFSVGAQLIFAGHETNILSNRFFRRDQFWFTQKDEYGATELYSLEEYRESRVRKDASFNKNYVQGKYGAIPFIGDIDSLFRY
ncbi:MAG: ATP-binding protein [bacterium]|nr:ATP-binding protein [bacterium]